MKYFVALALVLGIFAYSPKISVEWTNPGYKERTYSKIAVFAVHDDEKVRKLFEAKVAARLNKKKVNAVRGGTIFPDLAAAKELGPIGVIKHLREKGVDGVVTMSLVKTDMRIGYQKGETYSVQVGKEGFGAYWITNYKTISQPGYFESKKIFLVESNLFNLKRRGEGRDETLVWKGQSELVNPVTKYDAAVDFSKPLVKHLLKKKLIKPKKK